MNIDEQGDSYMDAIIIDFICLCKHCNKKAVTKVTA
jgi:hypothetical protein